VQGFTNPLASEVLHFKNFSHDGIVGVGAITYGAQVDAGEVQNFSLQTLRTKAFVKESSSQITIESWC
jgi:hypothetical protein